MLKQLDKDDRNIALNVFAAFTIKGASFIVTFVAMPLYIRYFNDTSVLGVWYTILSLLAWTNILDFGLTNGLRNMLTDALAKNNKVLARSLITTTYCVMAAISAAIFVVLLFVVHVIDLNSALNISQSVLPPLYLFASLVVLIGGICIGFVLKTINSVFYAMQRSSVNNFLALLNSILPLIYVVLAPVSGNDGESLLALSAVYVASSSLVLLIASFCLFLSKEMRGCSPRLDAYSHMYVRSLLRFGLQFFLAQLFFLVLMSTNEIIISRLYGPAWVVDYSVYYKLYTAIGALFTLALTPLWSDITRNYSLQRYSKIIRTKRMLYIIASIAMIAEFCVVPFTGTLLDLWLGYGTVKFDITTSIVFAAFGGLYVLNIALTTIANGIGELKTQVWTYGICSCLKIPVCILFARSSNWLFPISYTCCSLLLFCFVQIMWLEKRLTFISASLQ